MKNLFILYIALLCFNISYQLQCEEFGYSDKCDIFNTNYLQKCNNLGTSNDCYEIEIENGCKIEGKECVGVNQNDKCVLYDSQLPNSRNIKICKKMIIDEGCEIDSSNNCKSSKSTASCDYIDSKTHCYNKNSICENRDINSCTVSNDNCYKININGYSYCKTVEVDEQCKINNGDCKLKNEENNIYNECSFNIDNSRCEYKGISCDKIDSANDCSKCTIITPEKTCSKVKENNSLKCKEISIDTSHCEIKDGNCALKEGEQNNNCHYDKNIEKCQYYEQDDKCLIDERTGDCNDNPDFVTELTNNKKKCIFIDEAQTKCKVVNYECSDYYSQNDCEDATFQNEPKRKCSWKGSCKEYEIESPCTVKNGECQKKDGDNTNLGTDMECLFENEEEKKCLPKNNKTCETYYKREDCYSSVIKVNANKQCIYSGNKNCKEITIDGNCKVDKSDNICKEISPDKLKNTEICAFDDETEKNKCGKVDGGCMQIDKQNCNSKEKCSLYYNTFCYETDEYCTCEADTNGNLKPREGKSLKETEKCDLVQEENKFICKKVDKSCSDFTDGTNDKCETFSKINEKQCYKFKDDSTCTNVELDGNCKVIREGNEDKCVEDGSGKLSNNEKCAFNSGKTECKKREKYCSEFSANECNNFALSNKLCFKLSDNDICKEIKIDSQCKIDEDKNCVNKGCSFNKEKDKCSYNNNDSLKLKKFLLLLSLIML